MGLSKYKFGDLLELTNEKNSTGIYGEEDAIGVNIDKVIQPMRGKISEKDFTKFHLVPPRHFAYNPRGSRKLGIGFNNTDKTFIITFNDNVFRIKDSAKDLLLDVYLFMYLSRKEWDRYAEFISWGSSTEVFDWTYFCDEEINLPPLDIQQKYVDVYNAMLANQQSYERGLEDLKLTCDAYIEELRRKTTCEKIGPYIEEHFEKNTNNKITLFQGVNVNHVFTEPKRVAEDSENGSIVRTGQFAFNKVMKAHRTKLPIALRTGVDCVVSNSYQVFEVTNIDKLIPEYLMLWLNRDETQRYCGFISFGTTRDIFSFEDMKEIVIPVPTVDIQQDIVEIYQAYNVRKEINEKLKAKIKDLCPILIKGSIEEASR